MSIDKKMMLKGMLHTFLVVYFLISFVIAISNVWNMQNIIIDKNIFFKIMAYAFVGSLPSCVTYYRKEPSLLQIIFRRGIQLLLILVLVISLGIFIGEIERTDIIRYGILITLVYILEFVCTTIFNMLEAHKLTNEIQNFKKKHNN
ncbi:hypothetical protein [Anaerosporobacter sp.]